MKRQVGATIKVESFKSGDLRTTTEWLGETMQRVRCFFCAMKIRKEVLVVFFRKHFSKCENFVELPVVSHSQLLDVSDGPPKRGFLVQVFGVGPNR